MDSVTGGLTCSRCWTIPCICFNPPPTPSNVTWTPDYTSVLQRIAEALEDIAEKLESKEV